ncbi:circularly permuted type 2 ATP-grasp protein [Luteipulveratus flavus]|uniref:Circularly permuted type 2 ATP-grasp protein n=1 Tax=Luteipulveratus flavus TaxID=3031728 RepID=A0ABT6C9C5_9MICO|nr:circularly permuted type 2 ATP-grasp protein [Luteipulveratus sp. YIM 133296]MDF8265518.1 circularly permuted type 2 ATP-grasp protein [Luteipulveratus sp. YIM 133296]
MSAQVDEQPGGALEAYRALLASRAVERGEPSAPAVDELIGNGGVRPDHELLAHTVTAMGTTGLLTRAARARRFVQSDGVTYGSTDDGGQARNWHLDPLPVVLGAQEWAGLEAGLAQRAHLLDLVLADLYGERTLLHRRVVPAEVVLGHPGFVRQADRVRLPSPHQLLMSATDLARGSDGAWQVIADRTQAPSGAGYAMANRRIITRTMPALHRGTDLARLRSFFHTMRVALHDVAPETSEAPRVVVLSPGAGSETAFDQAFMATLLGFPLVEADDLTMRDGRVWVRTTGRLEPVDVILRRVDALWSDPLDLRADSQLGVPGLVEATRRGTVAVVNPLGAGVLENPGLQHFLGAVAREVLGEDLALGMPLSWWCGDDRQRSYVLAHLDELVLKPLWRDVDNESEFGWALSRAELDRLRARIEAQPWAWCAQEPLPDSSAPVVTRDGLEPRRLVLRTFAVAEGGDYRFLPGGLARVAASMDEYRVTGSAGALAKDVWVLSAPDAAAPPWVERSSRPAAVAEPAPTAGLAPRVAEDLFWIGRYAERAEGTARLLKVADDLTEDFDNRPGSLGAAAMTAVLDAVGAVTTVPAGDAREPGGRVRHLRTLVTDRRTPGTIAYAVDRLVQGSQQVRDQLSLDTWPILSRLEETLSAEQTEESQLQPLLERLIESLLALAGVMAQSMVRDRTWAYIDAGSRLERAQLTVALLAATLAPGRSPVLEGQVTEAILVAGESIITHRRRSAAGLGPASPVHSALDLLLLDVDNPRSVIFQLDRLGPDLELMGDGERRTQVAEIAQRLRAADVHRLAGHDRTALDQLLVRLGAELRDLADAVERRHFVRKAPQRTHVTEWTLGRDA